MQVLKCATCVGVRMIEEGKQAKERLRREIELHNMPSAEFPPLEELPEERDAVTFAPSWQSQTVNTGMGQVQTLIQCVSLPICREHAQVSEKSLEEKAMESGIALGRAG